MRKLATGAITAVLVLWLIPTPARADVIDVSFYKLTNNGNPDLSGQFRLSIYDPAGASGVGLFIGDDQVLFVFTNLVGIPSSIHEVYIDDGTVLGLATVINSPSFPSSGGTTAYQNSKISPTNLPGGELIGFQATEINFVPLSVDIRQRDANGLNAAEEILGIVYDVSSGLNGIRDALVTGDLRIGLHVGGLENGGSDSYVNAVPEPSLAILLGLGLAAVSLTAWRRGV